jgi:hypothetical protein
VKASVKAGVKASENGELGRPVGGFILRDAAKRPLLIRMRS